MRNNTRMRRSYCPLWMVVTISFAFGYLMGTMRQQALNTVAAPALSPLLDHVHASSPEHRTSLGVRTLTTSLPEEPLLVSRPLLSPRSARGLARLGALYHSADNSNGLNHESHCKRCFPTLREADCGCSALRSCAADHLYGDIALEAFILFFAGGGDVGSVQYGGLVLEMGASEGAAEDSNSAFFEKCLGWEALLIEGAPYFEQGLRRHRPSSMKVNLVAHSTPGYVPFALAPGRGIGGDLSAMDASFKAKWGKSWQGNVSVPGAPLYEVFTLLGIDHLDLFVLDVESAELKVLQTIDFARIHIDVIATEESAFDSDPARREVARGEINTMLAAQGFVKVSSEIILATLGSQNALRDSTYRLQNGRERVATAWRKGRDTSTIRNIERSGFYVNSASTNPSVVRWIK